MRRAGVRFCFEGYPYRELARVLPWLAADKLMRSHLSGGRENLDFFVTKILAGEYSPAFKILAAPLVVPDIDIGPLESRNYDQL